MGIVEAEEYYYPVSVLQIMIIFMRADMAEPGTTISQDVQT